MKGGASKDTAPRVADRSAPGAPERQLRNANGEPGSTDWVIIENEVNRFNIRSKKFVRFGVLAVPESGEAARATVALDAAPTTAPTVAGSVVAAAAEALAALSAFFCDLDRLARFEVARLLAFPAAPGTGGTGVGGTASHCCAAIACCCRWARLAVASSQIFLL